MNWQQDVATFMREVKELELPTKPIQKQPFLIKELCIALMIEELGELSQAMDEGNLVEIADGIADLLYVTLYTACAYGLDIEPIFAEIQRSNMTKKGGGKRADGKQLKGPEYSPPNIAAIIKEQCR